MGRAGDLVWEKVTVWVVERDQDEVLGERDPDLAVGIHPPGT